VEKPQIVPVNPGPTAGKIRLVEIGGNNQSYFGLTIQDPRIILPTDAAFGRREFHITVIEPPELEKLPAAVREQLKNGVDIPGTPQPGGMLRKPVDVPQANMHRVGYQLEVQWQEAQNFRASLGLGPKHLHVSLNGGMGEAFKARDAALQAEPDGQVE
jgi:hypothetical protein